MSVISYLSDSLLVCPLGSPVEISFSYTLQPPKWPVCECVILVNCDTMQCMCHNFPNILFCSLDKSLESLFWSLFGLTELATFATDKPEFQITRQTGVALFGLYQVLMAIVAINMLIAMMSRSFETIVVRWLME